MNVRIITNVDAELFGIAPEAFGIILPVEINGTRMKLRAFHDAFHLGGYFQADTADQRKSLVLAHASTFEAKIKEKLADGIAPKDIVLGGET
ncbi:hypothetical protein [Phaeobacter inhibens]|uniref:hypothetical protein n=1 Tax=Phaeobacter inhibens TaxID=221822 RepID=UPI0021A41AF1|nr:hypothetical protein [Phaeobacter inhibens]UWR41731.1 hypothetical protein K4F85_02145 [Phaeobacter inhibens]UWR94535.1 hypothetical protein K4K99_08875 [Phaeobacter inhibens]